jgi:dipeptidyl aminopeptidase/acylaminoacyl peptidase
MRPVFSPDGQKVAYEVYGAQHLIWVSPVAGGRAVQLDSETTDQHGPAWSPEGNWIAYRRVRARKWELVRVPFGGGQPVVLAEDTTSGGGESAWSPAESWICYRKGTALAVVSPDGKDPRPLTTFRTAAFGFSRDGSTIYAVRRLPTRKWAAVSIDVPSGKERKTVELAIPPAANIAGFSLHPDGTRFATSIGTPKSDIWLLEGFQKPRALF